MLQNWTLSFQYSLLYVILVFCGRSYMSNKPKFELRVPLIIWNCMLAVFSVCGAVRTIPEMVFMLRVNGFEASVCEPTYNWGPNAIWSHLLIMSKVYELGDTAFIVLRKRTLVFLHWYHHVMTLIYTWYFYTDYVSIARWLIVMNYTVHGFMYTYYALKAMKVPLPRPCSIILTSLQISQMFFGIFVIAKAFQYKSQGHFCQMNWQSFLFALVMYVSYLVLFVNFFLNAYIKPKSVTIEKKLS